jgi:hypothetical protein
MKIKRMKRIVLLSWSLVILINPGLISQSRSEIKNNFYEAESWILFEDYQEALPLYQRLLEIYPDNANYKYRIGQCYINTPGEKEKSIGYLEDAVKNINPKYTEGSFRETSAPYDALYFLANAYRINNQIDKAIEAYIQFKKNLDPKIYDSIIVNLQIQSCHNAKDLMANPLFIRETNLGNPINENTSEFNPVITDNENILVFSKSEPFYDAILYSTRNNNQWSVPVNMNEILKVDRDFFPTSLSADGKDLYLYSSVDYDGNIYISRFENGTWSVPVMLNPNINTKFWESHATVSHNNRKLYFTSNRKGGFGGLDIYVSERDSSGDWGTSVNLGSVINTPFNEETPFLSKDDKTLFFSSRGHFNMGGYDVFYSTITDNDEWTVPMNVGYPLNSTDDDIFFKPVNEGYEGYLAKYSPEGFGNQDIYRLELFSDKHPREFYVMGIVKVADLIGDMNDRVKISAVNTRKTDQSGSCFSDPATGEYELQLAHGNYEFIYEADGGGRISKNIQLPLTNPSDTIILPGIILPQKDLVADIAVGTDKIIIVSTDDPVVIPLRVETRSVLAIEHLAGIDSISAEKHKITRSSFNYKVIPLPGDNKIVFTLTDRFNNKAAAEVLITRIKTTEPAVKPEYMIAKGEAETFDHVQKDQADDKIRMIIKDSEIENQQFDKDDDVITNPAEFNKLAEDTIAPSDPAISIIRKKILAFSEVHKSGSLIRKSVENTDNLKIKTAGKWLQSVYSEAIGQGLTEIQLAQMLAILSSPPESDAKQFLEEFLNYTEDPLLSLLRAINVKKEKIKSPQDLINHIMVNEDLYPAEDVFESLARIIAASEIPSDTFEDRLSEGKVCRLWILWIVLGAGLIILFIVIFRKRRKTEGQ